MSASSGLMEMTKLYFEEGLPGFSHLQFFQLHQQESDSPFFLLVSQENPSVEFGLVDPFVFFLEYEFTLGDSDKENLRIKEDSTLIVLNIVALHVDGRVTVNLKAPVVVNLDNRMAKQVILNNDSYEIRQPLFAIRPKAVSE